jgi:four helix bundle protein
MKKKEYYLDLTQKLGITTLNLTNTIPINIKTKIILNQIIRSATSVGANYRAVCRSRSDAEFISKLGIVEEKADETLYWSEILKNLDVIKDEHYKEIKSMANHIVAFAIASKKTIKKRLSK